MGHCDTLGWSVAAVTLFIGLMAPGFPSVGLGELDSGSWSPAITGGVVGPAPSGLAITSFTATPSIVNVSGLTVLNVTVEGGSTPLAFAYRSLPTGCPSLNVSVLPCHPAEVRTFEIGVQVTDLVGDVATANVSITVLSGAGAPPQIDSFTAGPSSVAVGAVTQLSVVAESRSSTPTSSLSYTYLDLPAGCATFNESALECIPSQPGTFHLRVQVTDGFGIFAIANTTLVVTGAAAPASSPPATPLWWYGVAAAAALLVGAALVFRPRRAGPPPTGPAP